MPRTDPASASSADDCRALAELNEELQTQLAEVETREQLAFLAEQGCDDFQGYYFSPPVHPDRVPERLVKEHCPT